MLIMRRAVRLKDDITLPSGNVLHIDTNLEHRLRDVLAAYSAAIQAAHDAAEDISLKERAYESYAAFLKLCIGDEAWTAMLDEFGELNTIEICDCFKDWLVDVLVPLIGEASARNVEREKRRFIRRKNPGHFSRLFGRRK